MYITKYLLKICKLPVFVDFSHLIYADGVRNLWHFEMGNAEVTLSSAKCPFLEVCCAVGGIKKNHLGWMGHTHTSKVISIRQEKSSATILLDPLFLSPPILTY